jgi:peptidoglycan hydrolase-like protein with peptidoglycan-binding domain
VRRRALALGGAAATVAVAAVAIAVTAGPEQPTTALAAATGSLATVERGTLTSQVTQNGTLGYAANADGTPWTLVNQASGPYTRLPAAGAVVRCGEVLYRVDDEPVVLLCGRTPAYRTLSWGDTGPDVRQLNRNLVRLGYAESSELDEDSDEFGAETAEAVRGLQDRLGVTETGRLELGAALFAPRALRVTKVQAVLGTRAAPGSSFGQATSRRRTVDLELDPSQATGMDVGDRVRITLPDNRTAAGEVSHIGTVATAAEDSPPAITVSVALRRARDARGLDGSPVRVDITTGTVKDALSVPVTALVALAGGGYAVERAGGKLVPVELGMFDHAAGVVQVTGSLAAGDRIVVPGT